MFERKRSLLALRIEQIFELSRPEDALHVGEVKKKAAEEEKAIADATKFNKNAFRMQDVFRKDMENRIISMSSSPIPLV